jgi:hypothetical protein
MLKKYIFLLILSSASLLSMDPKKLSTQALKDQIARRQRWLAAYEQDQEFIRELLSCFQRRNENEPGRIERRNARICGWKNTISRFEAELAKRPDR